MPKEEEEAAQPSASTQVKIKLLEFLQGQCGLQPHDAQRLVAWAHAYVALRDRDVRPNMMRHRKVWFGLIACVGCHYVLGPKREWPDLVPPQEAVDVEKGGYYQPHSLTLRQWAAVMGLWILTTSYLVYGASAVLSGHWIWASSMCLSGIVGMLWGSPSPLWYHWHARWDGVYRCFDCDPSPVWLDRLVDKLLMWTPRLRRRGAQHPLTRGYGE